MSDASIPLRRSTPRKGAFRLLGDDRLARLAAEGNEHAFAAIYERHHQGLYRYCQSILRNQEDARDALQNTMIKVLGALPGENRSIALKPWLYRVARNEAISLIRRRGNDSSLDRVAEVADPQAADAAARERLRALIADLAELPERQRSALVMRELSGLSYQEIAVALENSPAAAKQSVYEAREALHQLAEGREMQCDAARHSISADDGRILRGRKLRAHLRSCKECKTFERAMRTRKADFATLAPPLPAAAAAALLDGVLGGGGGGGTGGGLLGVITGTAGKSAVGSAAVKATTAAVTVAVGVGAYEVAERSGSSAAGADGASGNGVAKLAAAANGSGHARDRDVSGGGDAGAASKPAGNAANGSGDAGDGSSSGGDGQSHHPAATVDPSSPGAPAIPGTPQADHGGGPPGGIPPGLGDAPPPGQAGSPPGLDGGAPPGHGGTPPGLGGGPPPGQATPPGLGGNPPGIGGDPPTGQRATPPGEGAPSGQGKKDS